MFFFFFSEWYMDGMWMGYGCFFFFFLDGIWMLGGW